jgi:hypothetical protein
MNRTQCPACLSYDVAPDDASDRNIDCHACGLWWDPLHPTNQPGSPFFGVEQSLVRDDPLTTACDGVEIVQALADNLARPDGADNSEVTIALQWDWSPLVDNKEIPMQNEPFQSVTDDERPVPTDEEYRAWASQEYTSDDINIDNEAPIAVTDTGAWVRAWVFVYDRYTEED